MSRRFRRGILLILLLLGIVGTWWYSAIVAGIPIWLEKDDYSTLSLAHAMNLEQRLQTGSYVFDHALRSHPGIPFYFASWIALRAAALTYPDQVNDIIWHSLQHPDSFYFAARIMAMILILGGTLLVWKFGQHVSPALTLAGGMAYLALSPVAWIDGFSYLTNESFALLWAAAFFLAARAVLNTPAPRFRHWFVFGLLGGGAYLIKLNYLALPLGGFAGIVTALFVGKYKFKQTLQAGLSYLAGIIPPLAFAAYLIKWDGVRRIMWVHFKFATHTGRYGSGDSGIMSWEKVSEAFQKMMDSPFFLAAIAIICLAFIFLALKHRKDREYLKEYMPLAVMIVSALLLAWLAVLKHYWPHYTLVPLSIVPVAIIFFLSRFESRTSNALVLVFCLIAMINTGFNAHSMIISKNNYYQAVVRDRNSILALPMEDGDYRLWTYHCETPEFLIGFTANLSGIRPVMDRLRKSESSERSSYIDRGRQLPWRYIVLDKNYFPTLNSVRDHKVYQPTDRLIEYEKMIVIDRTDGDRTVAWPGIHG